MHFVSNIDGTHMVCLFFFKFISSSYPFPSSFSLPETNACRLRFFKSVTLKPHCFLSHPRLSPPRSRISTHKILLPLLFIFVVLIRDYVLFNCTTCNIIQHKWYDSCFGVYLCRKPWPTLVLQSIGCWPRSKTRPLLPSILQVLIYLPICIIDSEAAGWCGLSLIIPTIHRNQLFTLSMMHNYSHVASTSPFNERCWCICFRYRY